MEVWSIVALLILFVLYIVEVAINTDNVQRQVVDIRCTLDTMKQDIEMLLKTTPANKWWVDPVDPDEDVSAVTWYKVEYVDGKPVLSIINMRDKENGG